VGRKFDQVLEGLALREQKGVVPPRFVIERVLTEMRGFAGKPGVFFANLRDMNEVPKFGMRNVAIHEGVPGHHFQNALAQEQEGVPTFRTVIPFTAYSEGWAL